MWDLIVVIPDRHCLSIYFTKGRTFCQQMFTITLLDNVVALLIEAQVMFLFYSLSI